MKISDKKKQLSIAQIVMSSSTNEQWQLKLFSRFHGFRWRKRIGKMRFDSFLLPSKKVIIEIIPLEIGENYKKMIEIFVLEKLKANLQVIKSWNLWYFCVNGIAVPTIRCVFCFLWLLIRWGGFLVPWLQVGIVISLHSAFFESDACPSHLIVFSETYN